MRLAEVTTLRLGGPAREVVVATTESELVDAVASADQTDMNVLLVAGGSNLVVADEGFDGRVVLVRTTGVVAEAGASGGVTVTVAAGEDWDGLVARAITEEWIGVEALSGIPGSVGATPVQNVGAYGQEVADTITQVRVWDRAERRIRTLAPEECGFAYRWSRFKDQRDRFLILEVTFAFQRGTSGAPIGYQELANRLRVDVGDCAPAASVRAAVLALRGAKGMVLDASDHDTWSAGSFFTNPVLSAEQSATLPAEAPRHRQSDGTIKTSAAWLIDRAGYGKGYGGPEVSLSTKHSLALTNRGIGTAEQLLTLAHEVRDGVTARFGIELVPEPVLINLTW